MADSLYYTVKHKELSERSNDAAIQARPGNTAFANQADIDLINAHWNDMSVEERERAHRTVNQIKSGQRRYDGSRFQSNILVR